MIRTRVGCSIPTLEASLRDKKNELKEARRTRDLDRVRRVARRIGKLERDLEGARKKERIAKDLAVKEGKKRAAVLPKLGNEALTTNEMRTLDLDERAAHVQRRMVAEKNALFPERGLMELRKFLEATDEATDLFPISYAALSTKKGKLHKSSKGVNTIEARNLADEAMHKRNLSIETRGEEIVVVDHASSREVVARNYAEAIFLADRLLHARMADPVLHMPGQPLVLRGRGPEPPKIARPGRVREDGTRVQTASDSGGRIAPLVPEQINIGWVARSVALSKNFVSRVNRLVEDAQRRSGMEVTGWSLAPHFDRIHNALDVAGREFAIRMNRPLNALIKKHKISLARAKQLQLHRAASWRDNLMETRRKQLLDAGTPVQDALRIAESELPLVNAEMATRFNLVSNELAFMSEVDGIVRELGRYLGISDDELRVGYYTRHNHYTQELLEQSSLEGRSSTIDALHRAARSSTSFESFYGAQLRSRSEAMTPVLDDALRAVENFDAQLAEQLRAGGNYIDHVLSYARTGIRKKVAGRYIEELQSQIGFREQRITTPDDETIGTAIRVIAGNAEIGSSLQQRLTRELEAMIGAPGESQAIVQKERRAQLVRNMKRLKSTIDKIEHAPLISEAVGPLKKMYESWGIKLTESQIGGWWETYSRLHRSMTFGLNPMASIRDTVSTDFLTMTRFDPRDFGQAWLETRLALVTNFRGWRDEFRRQVDLRWLDDPHSDGQSRPELQPIYEGRVLSALEVLQFPYKATDIVTRMLVNRTSELAAQRAFRDYSRSGRTQADYIAFLQRTGSDLAPTYKEHALRSELESALVSLDEARVVDVVRRLNESETAFHYARYASSPLMDSAPMRAMLMYGSWPLNAMSAMGHQIVSPWRIYGNASPALAARRSSELAAKWAAGSAGIYSLGAAFGVDTSDWVPFLHNVTPTGGPPFSAAILIRDMIAGDPILLGQFESNPGLFMIRAANDLIPGFPAVGIPNSVKRTLAMTFPGAVEYAAEGIGVNEESFRRAFNIPEDLGSVYENTAAAMGFKPFTNDIHPNWRRGGLPSLAMSMTVGRMMDDLHELSGGIVPPGTRDAAQDYEPPIPNIVE